MPQLLAGEINTYQEDKRYIHKQGHTIWIRLSVSVVRDADGSPLYFVSQMQDMSEQKHAQELAEQLRHSQKLDASRQARRWCRPRLQQHAHRDQGVQSSCWSWMRLEEHPAAPIPGRAGQARAAEQASTLPRQLLAFSRKQALAAEAHRYQ